MIVNGDPIQEYTTEYIAKEIGQSNPIDFNSEEEALSLFATKTFHIYQFCILRRNNMFHHHKFYSSQMSLWYFDAISSVSQKL